jgi:P-type conjugative transfer protein TrbJ
MIRRLFAASVLTVALALPSSARAQWVVLDPANLIENIFSALYNLESNINEVTSIANQMQGLANQITQINHEAQNLQQMPGDLVGSLVSSYTALYAQLATTFDSINGLAADLSRLSSSYAALYPSRSGASGPLDLASVLGQVQGWLTQARGSYQGIYRMSGTVMQAAPQAQEELAAALSASQSASGNLDALQAQTQVSAQIANQLQSLNAQFAALAQGQADRLSFDAQTVDDARKVAADSMINFATTGTTAPIAGIPAFH